MSVFTEAMATNPGHLAVLFKRGEDGSENFQWGLSKVPVLSAISAIARLQADLMACAPVEPCDHDPAAAFIVWDAASRTFSYFVHPDIPHDPLIGMLELIKTALVDSRLGRSAVAQRVERPTLFGTDGKPLGG